MFKRIKNIITTKVNQKKVQKVEEDFVNAAESYISSVQLFRYSERQIRKQLMGKVDREKAEELDGLRKQLLATIDRFCYLLSYISEGTVNKDSLKAEYDLEALSYHEKISTDPNCIRSEAVLLSNIITYSIFTRTVVTRFDDVFDGVEESRVNREEIMNVINPLFKDEEKYNEHMNILFTSLEEDFNVKPEDIELDTQVAALFSAAKMYPAETIYIVNKPFKIDYRLKEEN